MPYKSDVFLMGIHFPAMIFELITFILSFYISSIILLKWREHKNIATLYLSLALFSITFAVLIVFTGLASWFFTWIFAVPNISVISPAYYPITLPLGYCLVIIYDIFLFLFTSQIFFMGKNEKKVIPFVIIGIILAILLWLPTNYWGVNIMLFDPPSTRTLVLALYLLYNVIIYIILASYAFKEAKKSEDKEHRIGFQAIAYGQISNIIVFIFFLLDAFLLLLNPTSPGYSIFTYLAWACALFAVFLFYLGFILPTWFRDFIKK